MSSDLVDLKRPAIVGCALLRRHKDRVQAIVPLLLPLGYLAPIQMDYQLVIKFWRKSLKDETFLPAIQGELKGVLGDAAELDGYDVSDDEINLFVLTPDPRHSFRRIKTVLESRGIVRGVSAASRLVGGAHFTSIWPPRSTRKFRLP